MQNSMYDLPVERWDNLERNFQFITAWNEWNEQAVLEPSDVHGTGYLDAIRSTVFSLKPVRELMYKPRKGI